MTTVTVHRDGNAVGVTFPEETRARLGLEPGQNLTLVELPDGVKLVKHNPALERQMDLARTVLYEQADALKALARR